MAEEVNTPNWPRYSPKADSALLNQIERMDQHDPETVRLARERRAIIPRLREIHQQRGTLAK